MQLSVKEKKIALICALAIAVVLLYSLSLGITGFAATYSIEKKLSEKEWELNNTIAALSEAQKSLGSAEKNIISSNAAKEACQISLSDKAIQLDDCKAGADLSNNALSECASARASCEASASLYSSRYEAAKTDYKSLASSSAAAICCSFSDFQSGSIRQWSVESNKIICASGNYTVNCRTGETNM